MFGGLGGYLRIVIIHNEKFEARINAIHFPVRYFEIIDETNLISIFPFLLYFPYKYFSNPSNRDNYKRIDDLIKGIVKTIRPLNRKKVDDLVKLAKAVIVKVLYHTRFYQRII